MIYSLFLPQTLLRNERLTLTGIIISPEMQGIFDKWSWEGTGTFALSIAIPVGLQLFKSLRERYAIHKVSLRHMHECND